MVLNAASGVRNAQVAMQAMMACDVPLLRLKSARCVASMGQCRIGLRNVTPNRGDASR